MDKFVSCPMLLPWKDVFRPKAFGSALYRKQKFGFLRLQLTDQASNWFFCEETRNQLKQLQQKYSSSMSHVTALSFS